jgi:hypothetical protein
MGLFVWRIPSIVRDVCSHGKIRGTAAALARDRRGSCRTQAATTKSVACDKSGGSAMVIEAAAMIPASAQARSHSRGTLESRISLSLILVAITVLALFFRRPDQFLHPYIWVEDGFYNLKTFAQHGAYVLIEPLAGYHLFAVKLLSYLAFSISVPWAPEIELVLIGTFTCAVILAIFLSPTHLPQPFLCAIAPLLVPMAPEVFAVAPYAGWWAGLLLFLVPLWRSREATPWRWFTILLGGLSSPIIVPIAGIQSARAIIDRSRIEIATAALCVLVAAVQFITFWSIAGIPMLATRPRDLLKDSIGLVGSFFVGSQPDHNYYLAAGAVAASFFGASVWAIRRGLDRYFLLFMMMAGAACFASLSRAPLSLIHPYLSGPRYFFYPFVLFIWAGIWIATQMRPWARYALAGSYMFVLAFAWSGMNWRHIPLDWRGYLALCAQSNGLELPIQWGHPIKGHTEVEWRAFSGEECRTFIR